MWRWLKAWARLVEASSTRRRSSLACLRLCVSVVDKREPCKRGWTDRNAVWVLDSRGSMEPGIRWRPWSPTRQDIFRGHTGACPDMIFSTLFAREQELPVYCSKLFDWRHGCDQSECGLRNAGGLVYVHTQAADRSPRSSLDDRRLFPRLRRLHGRQRLRCLADHDARLGLGRSSDYETLRTPHSYTSKGTIPNSGRWRVAA